ncbi:hypothetical protein DRQ36_10325 [bacterium]|nr:MAG: hypothetical protein DRQ36_10325 [bacterium]
MLKEEEKGILSELPVGIVVVNPVRRVLFSNRAALRLLGRQDSGESSLCHLYIRDSKEPCVECPLEPDGINPFVSELQFPAKGCFLEVFAQLRENGAVIETITDISLRKNFQRELDKAALFDPGSGVFKRNIIRERLQREMHRARFNNTTVSIILVHIPALSGFNVRDISKAVARVLRGIGETLGRGARAHDHAYRFGIDTFIIILPGEDLAGVLRVAKKLSYRMAELGIEDTKIGVANMAKLRLADELIHTAQHALYRAVHSPEPISTA